MAEAALASSHFEPDGYGDARKFLINYYPEVNGGDPQRQTRLVNTPGSRLIDSGTVLTTGVRGLFQADGFAGGKIVVPDGTTIRLYDVGAASWSALTGAIAGTDRVKAVFGEVQAGFLANGSLYQSDGASVAALSDGDWATLLSDAGETAYTSIATMGQRLLASYGSRFAFSTTLQFNTTTTLSYYTAEYAPDGIVGLEVLNNTLLIFGTATIQPWVQTGDNDDPFAPIVGQEIDRGCMARDTIVKMDNGIAFIGDDRVPYIMRGLSLQRLNQNDPWVTRVLKATDAGDVVCSVIEDDGHSFYVIHTPTKCMVHDLATGTWHLRQSVDYVARTAAAVLLATLGEITLTATGTVRIQGELSATLGAITLEATGVGVPRIEGELSATLGALTLVATGEDTTVYASEGELNATLGAVTLAATAELVSPEAIAGIAVAYWLAEDLASQGESDASAPEVGDEVYTANNLGTFGTPWAQATRQTTGPILRADGTSYYWENTDSGLGTTTAFSGTHDVFMVCRKNTDAIGNLTRDRVTTTRAIGVYSDGSGLSSANNSGTPTISVDGTTRATANDLHDALEGAGWVLFRAAGAVPSAWSNGLRFPGPTSAVDVAAIAVVPDANVAANLTAITDQLNALITKLNA